MRAVYGPAFFPVNGVAPRARRELVMNDAQQPTATRVTIDCRLELLGDGQRDLIAQQAAFEAALSYHYQDFFVLADDGTIALELRNATSLDGVRVIAGPNYPEGEGAEYATKRTVDFTLSATYPVVGRDLLLRAFTETVAYSGGINIVRFAKPLSGKPVKQVINRSDTFRAVQSGQAVGVSHYPAAPAPLWPDALIDVEGPTVASPRLAGRVYEDFPVSWAYRFESGSPLPFRLPNVWR